jgi:hypothetical protein
VPHQTNSRVVDSPCKVYMAPAKKEAHKPKPSPPPRPAMIHCIGHGKLLDQSLFYPSAHIHRMPYCRQCRKAKNSAFHKQFGRENRAVWDTCRGLGISVSLQQYNATLLSHGCKCVISGTKHDLCGVRGSTLVLVRVMHGLNSLCPVTRAWARRGNWSLPAEYVNIYLAGRKRAANARQGASGLPLNPSPMLPGDSPTTSATLRLYRATRERPPFALRPAELPPKTTRPQLPTTSLPQPPAPPSQPLQDNRQLPNNEEEYDDPLAPSCTEQLQARLLLQRCGIMAGQARGPLVRKGLGLY